MVLFRKRTFSGGVHPPENKKLSESLAIENLLPPDVVVIPLQQHLGAPSEPIVEVGDTVKIGDKISEAKGFVSVPCHASISGIVKAIEDRPHPLGGNAKSIIIENDGREEYNPDIEANAHYLDYSTDEMRERIKNAGIVGLGGAAFPTHVKLSPPAEKPIDTFILNGAECEPYLTSDHRLMLEHSQEILLGMQIIVTILGCNNCIIGIEKNKPDAIEAMRRAVKDGKYNFTVIGFDVKYPQGAEKQLIKAAVGREVPRGGLPMDVKCLVQNIGTAKAIYEAVSSNIPLIERIVTVTGNAIKNPKNLRVRLGTPLVRLFEYCGGLLDNAGKIIMGGPMMGISQFTDEVPVIKGTSGIVVLTKKESRLAEPSNCIACARCVDSCPMGLMPTHICSYIRHERFLEAKEYGVLDCIECGCCAYICPAKLPLIHTIKYGKNQVYQLERSA